MYLTRHHTWPNKMKGGEEIWITVDSNWDRSVGSVDGVFHSVVHFDDSPGNK